MLSLNELYAGVFQGNLNLKFLQKVTVLLQKEYIFLEYQYQRNHEVSTAYQYNFYLVGKTITMNGILYKIEIYTY